MTTTAMAHGIDRPRAALGELVYRFEGTLADLYPIGGFPEGIRFHARFSGTVVAGPFTGATISGPDLFLLPAPEYAYLNRTTVVIEGHVNLASGELVVEAPAVERACD
jgi:hypothetical protein